jgi:predicted ATPase/DNA-binding SARP family transcriptional activator
VTAELRSSLPVDLTSFIGRRGELDSLNALLRACRLLTLTGAGGSGKTRLALELCHRLQQQGPPHIAWTDLAAVTDAALLGRQISEAFGIREEMSGDPTEVLIDLLRPREALLVLDNCEHLIDACADLVEAVLQACAGIRVLATSREALGVRGERAWLVPPLATPGPEHADAASCESVRLFIERARDAAADFQLTAENTAAVSDICRRLDGIPLAIELAAARTAVLTPDQIRQRLDNVFGLLTSGRRTVIPRHRTLRAAIDWSHELLRSESRILFRRLAVFRGGFTLDAAEEVASGDDIAAADVLDGIARLAERSLLAVREHQATARYFLLETVRQYAAERLDESGEAPVVKTRLAAHICRLIADAEPHLTGRERPAWVERLHADVENFRAVLHWSREHDQHLHVRLCGMLWWFWYSDGSWNEARRWLEDALLLPAAQAPTRDRAALLYAAGALASLQARADDARPALTESAELAAAAGDHALEAYALNYLGMTWAQIGSLEGRPAIEKAAAWFRAHYDYYGLRLAELLLGFTANSEGDIAGAIRHTEVAVAIAREHALDRDLSVAVHCLGTFLLRTGELDRAESMLEEALAASQRDPSYLFIARTLEFLGVIYGRRGEGLRAARVFGAAAAIRDMIGANRFRMDDQFVSAASAEFRSAVAAEVYDAAFAEGRARTMDEVIREILEQAARRTGSDGSESVVASPAAASAMRAEAPRSMATSAPSMTTPPVGAGSVPDLVVTALGPFRVVSGDDPPQERTWAYSKPKELLVYLLLHRAGRTRDQIAGAIWPGATPAQLRNSFHVTVHHLRKALGGNHWVVLKDERYRLDPEAVVRFDANEFESAVRAGLATDADSAAEPILRGALRLYRGDLLDGEVAGPWHEEHRANLQRLYVDASLRLAAMLEARGDDAAAVEICRELVARDDLNEEAHRRLMSLWARGGDRVHAIRHYERLVALLREVLDAEPEPETVALYDSIRNATALQA